MFVTSKNTSKMLTQLEECISSGIAVIDYDFRKYIEVLGDTDFLRFSSVATITYEEWAVIN